MRAALTRATIEMSLERSITQVGLGLPSALPDRFCTLLDGQRSKVDALVAKVLAAANDSERLVAAKANLDRDLFGADERLRASMVEAGPGG